MLLTIVLAIVSQQLVCLSYVYDVNHHGQSAVWSLYLGHVMHEADARSAAAAAAAAGAGGRCRLADVVQFEQRSECEGDCISCVSAGVEMIAGDEYDVQDVTQSRTAAHLYTRPATPQLAAPTTTVKKLLPKET